MIWLHVFCLTIAPAPPVADVVKARVPKQPVEISLEIPGFKARKEDVERVLLYGDMNNGAAIWVSYEENFPFLSGADCAKEHAKESGYEAFTIGSTECCVYQTSLKDEMVCTAWEAWPVTPEYVFGIHVSTYVKRGGKPAAFTKIEFTRLVKSWRIAGKMDRAALRLPQEVYAFRDEASSAGGDQLAWATKECGVRTDDWSAHFYLGALAFQQGRLDAAASAYARAAMLLAALAERTPKQTRARVEALDSAGSAMVMQKKFAEATPFWAQLVDVVQPNAPDELRKVREQALYDLARCHAMMAQTDKALEFLRQAIQARADFKKTAAKDEMLESLRKSSKFKALVGA